MSRRRAVQIFVSAQIVGDLKKKIRPGRDSNPQPLVPETNALSIAPPGQFRYMKLLINDLEQQMRLTGGRPNPHANPDPGGYEL